MFGVSFPLHSPQWWNRFAQTTVSPRRKRVADVKKCRKSWDFQPTSTGFSRITVIPNTIWDLNKSSRLPNRMLTCSLMLTCPTMPVDVCFLACYCCSKSRMYSATHIREGRLKSIDYDTCDSLWHEVTSKNDIGKHYLYRSFMIFSLLPVERC